MKYTIKRQGNGLYAPHKIGGGAPYTYEEAQKVADEMNQLLLSGDMQPTQSNKFYFPGIDEIVAEKKDKGV